MKNWMFVVISILFIAIFPLQAKEYRHHQQSPNHHKSTIEVTIIDEYGYRLPLYQTAGSHRLKKSYMQALRNQAYSIEVRNKTAQRVGFVVAVDGRNIISGKPSYLKSHEKMYILNPYQVSTFRGWRSSANSINRFYFSDEQHSYAAAFNDHSAMGVIAVAAFYPKKIKQPPHSIGNKHAQPQRHRRSNSAANNQAGTGWGETEHSSSKKVKFIARKKAFSKHLIKYEWRQQLCQKGIIHCPSHQRQHRQSNRLWDDGYATPPPNKRL